MHDVEKDPFIREVIFRWCLGDNTMQVVLSCGHSMVEIIPSERPELHCPACINEYI